MTSHSNEVSTKVVPDQPGPPVWEWVGSTQMDSDRSDQIKKVKIK